MLNEQWKAVKGYEGKYEVSNTGKVKSYLQNSDYYETGLHKAIEIIVEK